MIDTNLMPYAIAMFVVAAVVSAFALTAVAVAVSELVRERRTPATVHALHTHDTTASRRAA